MNKKRLISFGLSCIISIATICFSVNAAEQLDLANMDFADLSKLKQDIEKEMDSRPESEPFVLGEGKYVVGESIAPGRYYVYMKDPLSGDVFWLNAECNVYESKEAYEAEADDLTTIDKSFGEAAEPVILTAGNYLVVWRNPMTFSVSEPTEEDYFQYTPPEGTYVPAGTYTVGNEIPVGTYNVYPATNYGGRYRVYQNQEAKDAGDMIDYYDLYVTKEGKGRSIQLADGNVVNIDVDCIMAKQAALDFGE